MGKSIAQKIADLSDEEFVQATEGEALEELADDWSFWSRPEQQIPLGTWWLVWLVLAGRGFGKTRTGAETTNIWARDFPLITIVGPTADDIRDAMIEGESGILAVSKKDFYPDYKKSSRSLEWPNGAKALLISAEEPDRFRNKQHMKVWADELAAWKYVKMAWDMMMFGLRLGSCPQVIATTTPRPIPLIKELFKNAHEENPTVIISTGSTYENKVNLSPRFTDIVIKKYEGTRLGDQELHAQILSTTEGALWTQDLIDRLRVQHCPPLIRTVVAVDPSVKEDGEGDECGIGVAGVGWCGCKGGAPELHLFVIEDLTDHLSPVEWATRSVNAYDTHGAAYIVGEKNNGGALVEVNIRTVGPKVAYIGVTASQSKRARAEPIATIYERSMAHHVGEFGKLESEMTTWVPMSGAKSPNRLDWLVWAGTQLMLGEIEPESTASLWSKAPTQDVTIEVVKPKAPIVKTGNLIGWNK